MIFTTVIALIFSQPQRFIDVFAALFYFSNYVKILAPPISDAPFPLGHLWSLAVEEHFYLSWPLLFASLGARASKLIPALVLVLLGCLAIRSAWMVNSANVNYVRYASDARFDSIAYGCIFAFVVQFFRGRRPIGTMTGHSLFGAGLVTIFLSTYMGIFKTPDVVLESLIYVGQGVGLFAIFSFLYLSQGSMWALWCLERPVLRFVGVMSYGMYLWHYMVIYECLALVNKAAPDVLTLQGQVLLFAIASLASACIAFASYKALLVPFSRARHRLSIVS